MPFDGVEWDSPMTAPALAAYPGAPLTADALGTSLVSTYYAGRRKGRLFGQQTFSRLERSADDGDAGQWISSLTHQTIGGARGWIDETFTHAIVFSVVEIVATVDVELHLRAVATDGTTTATGTDVTRPVESNARQANIYAPAVPEVTYEESLVSMSAEVEPDNLTLSQRCRITAEGYAGTVLAAGYYRPRWVAIYLECRG